MPNVISSTCPIELKTAQALTDLIKNKDVKSKIHKMLKALEAPHSNFLAIEVGRRIYPILRPILMATKRRNTRLRMMMLAKENEKLQTLVWRE